MTLSQFARLGGFILVLAGALVLGVLNSLAASQTVPLEPAPSADGEMPRHVPAPDASDHLMDAGQLVPSYQCGPETPYCGRACFVGPSGQTWFRADYLYWWTQGARVVPLVTTSDEEDQGVIGQPSTEILFGDERLNGQGRSNFRIQFGHWLHCGRTAGIEFDYFTLGEEGTDFRFASNDAGVPLYARPFFDVNPDLQTPGQNAELVSDPTFLRGTVDGRIDEYFQSAGVNLRLNMICCGPRGCCEDECAAACGEDVCGEACTDDCGSSGCLGNTRAGRYYQGLSGLFSKACPTSYRVDFLVGYRHYRLSDSLRVHEDLEAFESTPEIEAGTTFLVTDEFRSRNDFHGAEIGLVTEAYRGCWSLQLLAKMAFGNNTRIVNIRGESTFQAPDDDPATYEAGILAGDETTNGGRHVTNRCAIIPQFGAELGYQLTCRTRAFLGYNLILWNDVARASEQVDYTLNSSYFPPADDPTGEARPHFAWQDSDFWAQGVNAGLEYRF
ncbi:MAG TPA: BBP7 family outer membrane beta-barrel protein [Thermoguttaceae bacterium]|nr:BBP7 family outer membrane beta-barrel protein [Thermoguttaceae bacterium]